jgi:hypothetical protein
MADIKRLHYFTGEFLLEDDFTEEQAYHLDMRRRHNRLSHGFGVVDGLAVTLVAGRQVQVGAGTAIDALGREIVLLQPATLTLDADGATSVAIAYGETFLDPEDRRTQGGFSGIIRVTERPIVFERTASDTTGVLLANVEIDDDAIASIDMNGAPRAAVSAVAANAIGEVQLANDAVTRLKIAANAVDGTKLAAGSVSLDKLAPTLQPPNSVKGVSNPGGDIDVAATNAITVSANTTAKRITIGESHSTLTTNPHQVTAAQVDAVGGPNRLVAQINSGTGTIDAARIDAAIARASAVAAKANGVLVFGQVTGSASPATVTVTTQNVVGKLVTVRGWATAVQTSSPGFVGGSGSGFWLTSTGIQFKEGWGLVNSGNVSSAANFLHFSEPTIATIDVQITLGSNGVVLSIVAAPASGTTVPVGYAFQVSWQS